jgi:hypothetical protein
MDNDEYEEDVYSEEWVETGLDDDELSSGEAGFMQGYIDSLDEE